MNVFIFSDLIDFSELNYGYKKSGNLNAIVTSGVAGWGFDLRTEHHSEQENKSKKCADDFCISSTHFFML